VILDRAGKQTDAGIEESDVDAVEIHVDDAGVRVEPTLAPLGKFQAVGLDGTLPDTNRAEATDPAGLPSSLPSTVRRSLPFSSMTIRGRRLLRAGSIYSSHNENGSSTWPSASMRL
jgi:hypothetical protein